MRPRNLLRTEVCRGGGRKQEDKNLGQGFAKV